MAHGDHSRMPTREALGLVDEPRLRSLQRMGGGGISLHSQRIRHTAGTENDLAWLSTQAPAAAGLLAHAKVNAVCHGCTGSGFLKSHDEYLALAAELERATGIPSVTSSSAIVAALRKLGAKKISVASPYEPWLNEKLRVYLEAVGFDIVDERPRHAAARQRHGGDGESAGRDRSAFAQAQVDAAPDQLLWGSDWPHVLIKTAMPNDGALFNLFSEWVPDAAQRQRILVDSPARVYDFQN